jgi:hypothetical protein
MLAVLFAMMRTPKHVALCACEAQGDDAASKCQHYMFRTAKSSCRESAEDCLREYGKVN